MTIGNPAFCLALYLTGVHFRGKLHHLGQVGEQKNQVSTNQNSKSNWCQIVRGTICKTVFTEQIWYLNCGSHNVKVGWDRIILFYHLELRYFTRCLPDMICKVKNFLELYVQCSAKKLLQMCHMLYGISPPIITNLSKG